MLRSVPRLFFFILALLPALTGSLFLPFSIHAFVPFLAILYYVAPFPTALWISFGCGLGLDLVAPDFRFGIHALTYTCATLLLFHQKKHFFEDKSVAVFLFTALISMATTLLTLLFIHIFDRGIPFSAAAFTTDIVLLSLVDALYGFLWFTCPMRLYIYVKKKGWRALFKYATLRR